MNNQLYINPEIININNMNNDNIEENLISEDEFSDDNMDIDDEELEHNEDFEHDEDFEPDEDIYNIENIENNENIENDEAILNGEIDVNIGPQSDLDMLITCITSDPIFNNISTEETHILHLYLMNNLMIHFDDIQDVKNTIYTMRSKRHPQINLLEIHQMVHNEDYNFYNALEFDFKNLNNCKREYSEEEINAINKDINNKDSREILLNNKPVKRFLNEDLQDKSVLSILSDEILEQILVETFPIHSLKLEEFYNIRLTCKRFYRIIKNPLFINKFLIKINPNLKQSILNRIVNIQKISVNHFNNIIYFYLEKMTFYYLNNLYGTNLIRSIGGFKKLVDLPFIFMASCCIDNLCNNQCSNCFHAIHKITSSPISRGIDDKMRPFILFIYENIKTQTPYYEFIYNIPNIGSTFSGYNFNTYIGNKSVNYSNSNSIAFRSIDYKSYDYIERLVQNKPTGAVNYDFETHTSNEDMNNPIKLKYNIKNIEKQIKLNFLYDQIDILE